MKKIYLIVFSLILYLGSFAQNSFPTSNAIWNESIEGYNNYYGLLGDTIINDIVYSKLYQLNDTILAEEYKGNYIGAFRNDEQKVFFKPKGYYGYFVEGEPIQEIYPDILLYDFEAEVGDTVKHNALIHDYNDDFFCVDCPEYYSVVVNISIENNRKVYAVNGPVFFNWWVEGIGSDMGVLRAITTSPLNIPPHSYILNCFKHNDTVKYLNSPCNQCFCQLTSISTEKIDVNCINIFPNPSDDILQISANNEFINRVEILDNNGRLINKYIVDNEMFKINVFSLKSANYVIKIVTKSSVYIEKFIKK